MRPGGRRPRTNRAPPRSRRKAGRRRIGGRPPRVPSAAARPSDARAPHTPGGAGARERLESTSDWPAASVDETLRAIVSTQARRWSPCRRAGRRGGRAGTSPGTRPRPRWRPSRRTSTATPPRGAPRRSARRAGSPRLHHRGKRRRPPCCEVEDARRSLVWVIWIAGVELWGIVGYSGPTWTNAPRRIRTHPGREESPHPAGEVPLSDGRRHRSHPGPRLLRRGLPGRRLDLPRSSRNGSPASIRSATRRASWSASTTAAPEAQPDKQGRVMVPPPLIEHAWLGREVVVVGMRGRIEVWDRAAWRAQIKEVMGSAEHVAERLATQRD